MLTAVGRLPSSAVVGRGGFPASSAVVGRGGRWRSSGCVARTHNRQFALYKAFSRFFVAAVVSLTACALVTVCIRFICVLTAFSVMMA